MVDQYGLDATRAASLPGLVKTKNLGAVILWNPAPIASGEGVRTLVTSWARVAREAGMPELFVATDQEEAGTQRLKSDEGFTNLVDGATLGRSVAANGDARICELHARITARELAAVGMNMSLGTVSDLFTPGSGTTGMFRTRAIGADPEIVAQCITAMTRGYFAEQHVVFITKHFPGLGNASGNTDVDPSVATKSVTRDAMDRELAPYRAAVAAVNATPDAWPFFGTMVSHASYAIIDGSGSPATLSPAILSDLLRGAETAEIDLGGKDHAGLSVKYSGIHLQGLTVSDAFWTWGLVRGKAQIEKFRLMAQAFLAGIDILMIAQADFGGRGGAWDYFQALNANQLPPAEKAALSDATKLADFDAVHTRFVSRLAESAARIRAAKSAAGSSLDFAKTGAPNAGSADLVAEYKSLVR
jgi:beta-glucosidase-like glycosyl hydrolase